jgi:hypothetical protein
VVVGFGRVVELLRGTVATDRGGCSERRVAATSSAELVANHTTAPDTTARSARAMLPATTQRRRPPESSRSCSREGRIVMGARR